MDSGITPSDEGQMVEYFNGISFAYSEQDNFLSARSIPSNLLNRRLHLRKYI